MGRFSALAAALLVSGVMPAPAQYFGQNKVQYHRFDWQVVQTEHFEAYYYEGERTAALDAARMAERAYARLSKVLHHQFRGRKPIILYASHSDFQQTNALPGDVSEGTQGVTEFFKHRMVLPFTGSYADFEHVLMHEMVHQFQYDVFSRGRPGAGIQTIVSVNPPGWFMEGMAEYLSSGPIDPHTAMWLRDAALEGRLPTIEQLTYNPNIFPYRFGHAIFSYIGERWGDEVIGEILQASVTGGIPGAVRRSTGLTMEQLSDEWRDAVQTTYLPQLANHYRARRIAQPLLTERRTQGTLNLAPALTPDGRQIAFFSERNNFFVDLWLADAETGRVKRRLVRSTLSTNYESLRFIFSSGAFSPDGHAFAIAAKHEDRDDLVILDVRRNREERRIEVPLSGLQTPAWSPDGRQLVFTGFDGGLSDLYVINRDGTGLRRLTNDRYADLQPAWSPDGNTIAFVTDRGPETDFDLLRFANMRIALYDLATGTVEPLPRMEQGKNINPAWSPDGRALAFVSDRTGISNLFLYDRAEQDVYQLTDVYTGVTGISPLSPAISWAKEADRLAFAYYEEGKHHVYTVENPRSLKRAPYRAPAVPPVVASLLQAGPRRPSVAARPLEPPQPLPADSERVTASVYRTADGFRESAAPPPAARGHDSTEAASPVSVRALLDSARLALPDTTAFGFRPYRVRYSTDYVARPTVGYQRDNFGRGVYGGTAVALSDILGDHTLIFAGAVNGRLAEAEALAAYINQRRRLGWAVGGSQQPLYFYERPRVDTVPLPDNPSESGILLTSRIRRLVIRQVFGQAYYPFSRFQRLELGLSASNVSDATLEVPNLYARDDFGRYYYYGTREIRTVAGPSVNFVQPSVALVHDKSLFAFVGPFAGSRWRLQYSPTFGDWRFDAAIVDYRQYIWFRPFTLAFRGFMYGRFGRDADRFHIFLGSTELIRGYTAGSFRDRECIEDVGGASQTGCAELDQLIGSKVAVANVELRFPLAYNVTLGFLGVGIPPIEAAAFYDVGIAWDEQSVIKLQRDPGDDFYAVRRPLRSYGASVRMNMLGFLIFRFDYTQPLDRGVKKAYWTVSLGPTF